MTYPALASTFEVRYCPGCPVGNHQTGWASSTTVHWRDRRVNRLGLRRFLMLVASVRLGHTSTTPRWRQIYEQNRWAARAAADHLHIRFPPSYAAADRARLLWLATQGEPITLAARRWAAR